MARYAIYLRVSTEDQSDKGNGLNAQLDACIAFVSKQSGEIIGVFRDEGVSGAASLEKRIGLMEAINELSDGDILLIAKRDRLGRDPIVVAMIEAATQRKGARILSAAGEGTENDDPTSILMRRIVDAFAEYERLVIKARTKAALQSKKKRSERIGHIPFGYALADDGKHLVESEEEQWILREIRTLKDEGFSLRDIALELNNRGLTNRGSQWNHMNVKRVAKL